MKTAIAAAMPGAAAAAGPARTPTAASSPCGPGAQPASATSEWEQQHVLFAPLVSRRALLDVCTHAAPARTLHINVWRNHAFEPLQPLMAAYSGFGRWAALWQLGAYDDTLGFAGWQPADLELVWLDRERLQLASTQGECAAWLASRLAALRGLSTAPIVVASWGHDAQETQALAQAVGSQPGAHWADLRAACDEESTKLLDARAAALAGTPLSAAAQLLVARRLACHWLAAAGLPPIKAVALDLDHTLHAGVLGEDGAHGVQLSTAHAALQQQARALRERGVFLALVSRNEAADVQALFAQRTDYPLRWDDFSVTEVSWGDKASALARVATQLRIAPEAVLFVDDNIGELLDVRTRLPQVHTLHAQADARATQRALAHYPGLWRWSVDDADTKRVADLASNGARQALAAQAVDAQAYFLALQVRLQLHRNRQGELPRVAELCRKTNQFNLALQRLPEAALAAHMADPLASVVTVALADRLADSGIVAVVVARRQGPALRVLELCISCRALGRQMEDTIVFSALRAMPAFSGCSEVVFEVNEGERNQPAREWLQKWLCHGAGHGPGQTPLPAAGAQALPACTIAGFEPPAAIQIEGDLNAQG